MNMPNPARDDPPENDLSSRASTPGLSLKAYVEREFAAIAAAGGPTMAEIVAELDTVRSSDGPTREDILTALEESRAERDERLDSIWRR